MTIVIVVLNRNDGVAPKFTDFCKKLKSIVKFNKSGLSIFKKNTIIKRIKCYEFLL